ncbi:biogenesis of lysosome-related organelles complex 1 subunit 1-like protein [Leptotrombidium deliense]|uniref:Biogenesis of lysosome-related organelles complex 1 subunit 1 n=1 Tax=Leptotrombidium deliense TaxID=299467 RepID=A0A443RWH5_9ACAR|nr:biogenesis of lysosome-related organelles complex 1 subunit 1-like protein [Leptotrombidium deliense]
MLSSLHKEHQKCQQLKKEEIEKKREETLNASNELTFSLINHLNEGNRVAKAYLNQRKLDAEAKQLQNNVNQFTKQTTQWLNVLDNLNKCVKELGDVQNWATTIENDMRLISTALEYAYKVGPQPKR